METRALRMHDALQLPFPGSSLSISLADGTVLPDCRPDLLSLGDLMARNWSLFPLKPRSKVPAVKWEEFQRRHATFNELESWFTKPGYNVAIVTGAISKIFVVDCDSEAALAWARENLPACDLRVKTPRGVHLYFPYSGDRPMKNKVRVKFQGETLDLDFRAEGGYVVGAGSTHESGALYVRQGEGWRWS